MDGQTADGEALQTFAHPVDVDEKDENAALFDRSVLCDTAQIGRERDVGSGSRVEARQGGRMERKRVVVFGQLDEHVDDQDKHIVDVRIVKEVGQYFGIGCIRT